MVRTRLVACSLFLTLTCSGSLEAEGIEIDRFDVSILLDADSTFYVTESIHVDFGALQKRGIFRTIPVAYSRSETVAGVPVATRYALRLWILSVKDGDGRPIPFTYWPRGPEIFIRIGDPDGTVTGNETYVITYRVQRAINYFESHDELYWNVTGTEWEWPIHRASVRVVLPGEFSSEQVRHKTFTGRFGARATAATERLARDHYEAEVENLGPGEGLTFVLGLPRGTLAKPSAWREFWWKAADNVAFFLAALVPISAFGIMLFLFLRTGRDPGRRMPIMVEYEPPTELSPAEMGSLLDERIDTPDIVSTVIDLAVRGYLKIEEVETTKYLFLSHTDYRFERRKRPDEKLSEHERAFLTALFGSNDSVMLSDLKYEFYRSIPGIRAAITRQLLDKKLFPRDPERTRRFYRGVAVAAVAAPVGLGAFLVQSGRVGSLIPPEPSSFGLFAILCLALAWLVIRIFSRFMPAKTTEGARLARRSLGFKEFVTRVERDRIARMAKEDPTLFERVLPYAVVLGVADEWAQRFEGLLTEPPSWYRSSSFESGPFYPGSLVTGLGQGMNAMGSTLTSQPRSSGGSGSGGGGGFSGFGGGGGSGGGFGGGGGGSW